MQTEQATTTTPSTYTPVLGFKDTQRAIDLVHTTFKGAMEKNLGLTHVRAPLFIRGGTGY
jgi:asparagine synthetase A